MVSWRALWQLAHASWPHSCISQWARCGLRHSGCFPDGISPCWWLTQSGRERESVCAHKSCKASWGLGSELTQIISPAYYRSMKVPNPAQIQGMEEKTPYLNSRIFTVTLRGHRCREGQNVWPFLSSITVSDCLFEPKKKQQDLQC